jgi:hypothetical protein
MAAILKTPEIGKKYDVKSVMASEIQRIALNLMIFGYEASLGGHFSRKLALFSGSGQTGGQGSFSPIFLFNLAIM